MICDCCKKENISNFEWHNIPTLGGQLKNCCDNCALRLLKSFLEEHSSEYDRTVTGKEKEYEKCIQIFKQIKEDPS